MGKRVVNDWDIIHRYVRIVPSGWISEVFCIAVARAILGGSYREACHYCGIDEEHCSAASIAARKVSLNKKQRYRRCNVPDEVVETAAKLAKDEKEIIAIVKKMTGMWQLKDTCILDSLRKLGLKNS